ncbi:MAG: indolepyruvate oxidoreductase subunit beta [Firmicutes bacterium ADurb.Bin080]|jgi:indolepyruvate ferredoxin oxidoreductase beta subunit|nr:indolepyruvate oxidoreductase subunit beta [Clostridiales bacterium]OQC12667.1 MAG: indolepyruvate oxidoreductase subunit beta [Firmicutes bacterium ADurb.Bin080]
MKPRNLNILIVGVGGQGTLLASRILGTIALNSGLKCKLSEVHGMSQRGGSVVTHVRWGKEVFSPIVCEGDADYILSFETLEAIRWSSFLKENGHIIVNNQKILPMPVITGKDVYPKDALQILKDKNLSVIEVDGLKLAELAGSSKAVNVVLIGILCAKEKIELNLAKEAIKQCVKEKNLELNLIALELGYNAL